MRILAEKILTPHGFEENRMITVEDGRIIAIDAPEGAADIEAEILTPGLIDLHCHGGEGFNALACGLDQMIPFLDKQLACGVTDFLMTVSGADKETVRRAMTLVTTAMNMQKTGELGGAHIAGVHLEGPFLSRERLGAMNEEAVLSPSVEKYEELYGAYDAIIKEISLAPEEGADELIEHLIKKGIRVQAGHTNATYEEAMHGFEHGVTSLCHSFNACRPIHHREPGVVTAALVSPDVYMEAICDFVHLHPGTVRLIYGMKGAHRMMTVSDSTLPHGLPDGKYNIGGSIRIVKNGVHRTSFGALSGGTAYLDQEVRNLISIGIEPENALTMASRTPAEHMGFDQLGTIAIGKDAHLTAWDAAWRPVFTFVDGRLSR